MQRSAIAAADKKIEPAMKLYELRNYVSHKVGLLSLAELVKLVDAMRNIDLKALVSVVGVLSDAELQQVAAFAEGLALWHEVEPSSSDAESSPRGA